jgi:hypothetical protein
MGLNRGEVSSVMEYPYTVHSGIYWEIWWLVNLSGLHLYVSKKGSMAIDQGLKLSKLNEEINVDPIPIKRIYKIWLGWKI